MGTRPGLGSAWPAMSRMDTCALPDERSAGTQPCRPEQQHRTICLPAENTLQPGRVYPSGGTEMRAALIQRLSRNFYGFPFKHPLALFQARLKAASQTASFIRSVKGGSRDGWGEEMEP